MILSTLFCSLLKKNVKTDYRSWVRFVVELAIIVVICLTVTLNTKTLVHEGSALKSAGVALVSDETPLEAFNHDWNLGGATLDSLDLVYAPLDSEYGKEIATEVQQKLGMRQVIGFKNAKAMEESFDEATMFAGINFGNDPGGPVPKMLDVDIYFPATLRSKPKSLDIEKRLWRSECANVDTPNGKSMQSAYSSKVVYQKEGFLNIQDEVFKAWVKKLSGHEDLPRYSVNIRAFYYKSSYNACAASEIGNLNRFLLAFLFFYPFGNIIWRVGRDVENNVIIHHWQYNCPLCIHFLAHFFASLAHLILLDIIIILLLKLPYSSVNENDYPNSGWRNLMHFLLLYNVALIVTAFLIATSVYSAFTAVIIGMVIWIFMLGVFFSTILSATIDNMNFLYCSVVLFCNSALPFVFLLLKHDADSETLEVFYFTLLALLGNIIFIYIMLLIRHMVFPLRYLGRNAFKVCSSVRKRRKVNLFPRFILKLHTDDVNRVGMGRLDVVPVVTCKNVTTIGRNRYSAAKEVRIRNVSMNIYPGEITFLLGPHGCGKTTMLRLLGGLLHPDFGFVYYDKMALSRNFGQFGFYCETVMMENHLFDMLTVEETLLYFITIKGNFLNEERRKDELRRFMKYLKPVINDPDTLVCKLNFEQKKFLCLCCALSCGTKILLLDEPTKHLCIKLKALFWNILRENKAKRTIIVASTNADSAEQVADRIAVFHNGSMKCYGSIFFLKNTLRTHFQLIILKEEESVPTEPITAFLLSQYSSIRLQSEIGDQVIYKIPVRLHEKFQLILIAIKRKSAELHIVKTTIIDFPFSEIVSQMEVMPPPPDFSNFLAGMMSPYNIQSDRVIINQQFRAMFHLRYFHQNYIIPLFCVLLCFGLCIFLSHALSGLMRKDTETKSMAFKRMTSDPLYFKAILQNDCRFSKIERLDDNSVRPVYSDPLDCYRRELHSIKDIPYGAVFTNEDDVSTIWVNQNNVEAAPAALNLLHNRILGRLFPDDPEVLMRISHAEFPPSLLEKLDMKESGFLYLVFPIAIGTVWPILTSCYVLFISETRLLNLYTMLEIAGLRTPIFWTVNFVWDILEHFMFCMLFLLLILLIPIQEMYIEHRCVLFLLMLISGVPTIWFTYFIGLITTHSKLRTFFWCCLWSMTFGLLFFIFYWQVARKYEFIHHFFLLSPHFALIDALAMIHVMARNIVQCKETCAATTGCKDPCKEFSECCNQNVATLFQYSEPGMMECIVFMCVSTMVYLALCCLILLRRRDRKFRTTNEVADYRSYYYENDDPNVISLRKYIANLDLIQCRKIRVCVDQLEKDIPKNTTRIRTVSFNVDKYCCLCIYGGHKSMKTHMARQLVGDIGFQFGEVYMRGLNLRTKLAEARKIIGYCPQYGGYYDNLTVFQIFYTFYMIRGVPTPLIKTRVIYLTSLLKIRHFSRMRLLDLGEKEKRKVKIGLSIIALNKIIILDEPTDGLDGGTKFEIWMILRFLCSLGRAVIVFTTDTVECKFLSNYVLAMDQYSMLAYGNLYGILDRFSDGFVLKVKVMKEGSTKAEVERNLESDFENVKHMALFFHEESKELERNDDVICFHCPVLRVNFSYLYGEVERRKRRLNIVDYSIEFSHMFQILNRLAQDISTVPKKQKPKKRFSFT